MKWLAIFSVLVACAVAHAATTTVLAPTFAPAKVIPNGVYDINRTIIIPRQRKLPRESNKAEIGVPAPFLAKDISLPGGWLRGEDRFGTVLRFAPTVKGALIETEDYGKPNVGRFWNDNNSSGDLNLRANLCSMASDFSVDGRAELHPYPWSNNISPTKPDPHGPDFPFRANGLCAQGSGFRAERLRFYQIPGTALWFKGGRGTQAGPYGIYDDLASGELNNIYVSQAINGIVVEAGDSKLHAIYVTGIVRDGLTMSGPGSVVDLDHICGADRAVVVTQETEFHTCYHEAARIGTHIMPTAHRTRIDGLNIGPATCWERGIKIEANGCTIKNLHGNVKEESEKHPDIAGVEISSRVIGTVVEGGLTVDGDGSDALILRGLRNRVDLKGGWNKPTNATFVRVAEAITGSTIEIRGGGDKGTVLDLSASGLDKTDGLGNEFKVKWKGTAQRVVYPGGGTKYNLAPGNQLWIDGRLQSSESLDSAK